MTVSRWSVEQVLGALRDLPPEAQQEVLNRLPSVLAPSPEELAWLRLAASPLLPLCVSEPRPPLLKSIAQEDAAIVAWWMTLIECFSAFARLRREGVLTRAEEDQARRVLNRLGDLWTEVQPGREIRDRAGRILLLHPLRAADSLQLAAALTWAHGNPTEQPFVCLDHRLRAAAQQEGFRVLPDM